MVILNNSNNSSQLAAVNTSDPTNNRSSQPSSYTYDINSFYLSKVVAAAAAPLPQPKQQQQQPPPVPPRTGLTAEKLNNYSRFLPSNRLQQQQQQHLQYVQTADRLLREQQPHHHQQQQQKQPYTRQNLEEKSTFLEFESDIDFIDAKDEIDDSENDEPHTDGEYDDRQHTAIASRPHGQLTTSAAPFLLPSQYIDLSLFFYSPPSEAAKQQDYQPTQASGSTPSSRRVLDYTSHINSYNQNRLNALHTSSDSSVLTASTTSASSTTTTTSNSSANNNNTSSDCSVSDRMIMMPSQHHNHNHNQHQQQQPTSILSTSNGSNNNFFSNNANVQHQNVTKSNMNSSNAVLARNIDSSSGSDEHEDLLAEMELIERLPTQERLKQAKRRRALQLKKWSEYEKEYSALMNTHNNNNFGNGMSNGSTAGKKKRVNITSNGRLEHQYVAPTAGSGRNIKFQDHVVLLDAIMRKDRDEVERLLRTGIAANAANEDGLTAIHQVCFFSRFLMNNRSRRNTRKGIKNFVWVINLF
jgi:hypothetical protein